LSHQVFKPTRLNPNILVKGIIRILSDYVKARKIKVIRLSKVNATIFRRVYIIYLLSAI
jgi:hypothetical protein